MQKKELGKADWREIWASMRDVKLQPIFESMKNSRRNGIELTRGGCLSKHALFFGGNNFQENPYRLEV